MDMKWEMTSQRSVKERSGLGIDVRRRNGNEKYSLDQSIPPPP
jgi:hypothetical protein